MAGSQVATGITVVSSLKGFQSISLTNISNTTIPQIAAGSFVELSGAYFQFASDETINATSWTAVSTGGTAYISLTPSGTAGSQVLSAAWTEVAPSWATSRGAWYASAASASRIIGGCLKEGATTAPGKFLIPSRQKTSDACFYISSGGTIVTKFVQTAILEIGVWDMDADQQKDVPYYLGDCTVVGIDSVLIENDLATARYDIDYSDDGGSPAGEYFDYVSLSLIRLQRTASGFFDDASFDSTSKNRGYITIRYIAE